jgi:hypothetical protein
MLYQQKTVYKHLKGVIVNVLWNVHVLNFREQSVSEKTSCQNSHVLNYESQMGDCECSLECARGQF